MAVNRGKQFEQEIKKALVDAHIAHIRLNDNTSGFAGVSNPCDFIVYRHPTMMMVELKSVHGDAFSFDKVPANQMNGLTDFDTVKGVTGGLLIWFVEHAKTVYLPIQSVHKILEGGKKSINVKKLDKLDESIVYELLPGIKKKVLISYDGYDILDTIETAHMRSGGHN